MTFTVTVLNAGTFDATATPPASFVMNALFVPGPQGPTGATGPAGVVAATAPITYNAGTQTVGIDQSGFLLKSGNLAGLADLPSSRLNLGLGSAAVAASGDFAAAVHTHTASQISDSTTSGRALLTAADAAAQRTSLGLGSAATEDINSILTAGNNLSDVQDVVASRFHLGLGTMATETAADYLTKAGNLSGLASASTARTNLGLGSAATSSTTDFAAAVHTHTASQISDSTTAGRALLTAADAAAQRTSLDVYSKAQSDAIVPAASTTTAGKVELATDAEAVAGTSATLAVTPSNVRWAIGNFVNSSNTASTTANGGSTASNIWDTFTLVTSATLANSTARRWSATYSSGFIAACVPGQPVYKVDFSKPFAIRWGIGLQNSSSAQFEKLVLWVAQDTFNLSLANDEAANIGFGCVLYSNGNLKISARSASGVTSTTIASGIPMIRNTSNNNPATEIVQVSDGLGNLYTYIDGALVDTRTSAPTSLSDVGTSPFALWGAGLTNGATTPTATCTWTLSTPKVFFGR